MSVNEIIWNAYEKSIDPAASVEERSSAQQTCDDFKNNPQLCVPLAVQWAQCIDAKSCFFGLHCLEHVIKTSWNKIPVEFQRALRSSILQLLKTKRNENYLSTMLSRCLSHIIERDWPTNWPEMLQELEELGEVTALRIFLEEVFLFESILTARRRELTQAVQTHLVPVLFPQLLGALQNLKSSDDQISVVLSVLYPISHLSPDATSLLKVLTVHMLNTNNRKLAADCVQKLMKTGRKKLPITETILPVLCQMQPTFENFEFMESFSCLLCNAYSYDPNSFKMAIFSNLDRLYNFVVNEDFADQCPDSYFNLMSILCDLIDSLRNDQISHILLVSIKIATQPFNRDADMEESRGVARIRNISQRFCTLIFKTRPDIFNKEFVNIINTHCWPYAVFLLQSMEGNSNETIQNGISNLYATNQDMCPTSNFLQLAFKHASSKTQVNMLKDLLLPEDEQGRASAILSLSRDPRCQPAVRLHLGLLMDRLVNIQDCLAVSMLAEAVLLLVKGDANLEENVLSVILQPCNVLFTNNLTDIRQYSIALHLMTSIARSVADTQQGKIQPFIQPIKALVRNSNECYATKAVEFLAACRNSNGLFIPDQYFAQEVLTVGPEIQRSVLRQILMPMVNKEMLTSQDFIFEIMFKMPPLIDQSYSNISVDISPEQDSQERQVLALLSRDLVEIFRKVCLAGTYLERLSINEESIIGTCFQGLYMFPDSVAIQRLVPVCTKLMTKLPVEMELPALLCGLRALKKYIKSDREALGHELTVLASQLFDRILSRVGIEVTTELFRQQIGSIEREDVIKYHEAMYSGEVNEKKRKKIAEALFIPALRT